MKAGFSRHVEALRGPLLQLGQLDTGSRQVEAEGLSLQIVGRGAGHLRAVVRQKEAVELHFRAGKLDLAAKRSEGLAVKREAGDFQVAATAQVAGGAGGMQ